MIHAFVRKLTYASLAGALLGVVVVGNVPAAVHKKSDINWDAVGQALGIPGTMQSAGVYRIDIYRTDLNVTLPSTDRKTSQTTVHVLPAFALGGYLVFLPTGGTQAMMMGDLVLTESEIEPVMLKLEEEGIDVAAIHNHLLWEKPTVMYMHLMVMGDAVQLATAVHNALALTPTPLVPPAAPPPANPQIDLNTAALDTAMGATGKIVGGVYKYSFPPAYPITSMGMTIPASMGMSTGLTFQPLGNGRAAVTGDFALRGNQINPVIMALRTNGILVTALHSHMLDATPTVFFMHFYATGDALKLAQGLRAGLNAIAANPAT
jgi:hypothetical protein